MANSNCLVTNIYQNASKNSLWSPLTSIVFSPILWQVQLFGYQNSSKCITKQFLVPFPSIVFRKILWKSVANSLPNQHSPKCITKQFLVPIDFHSILHHILYRRCKSLVTNILQNALPNSFWSPLTSIVFYTIYYIEGANLWLPTFFKMHYQTVSGPHCLP